MVTVVLVGLCVMSDEEEGAESRDGATGCVSLHPPLCTCSPRWRDDDAGCLTTSRHYRAPTLSTRLPLQLDKPAANRLDSLTEQGFEDCILTFVIRWKNGLCQGLLHLVYSRRAAETKRGRTERHAAQ